MTFTSIAVIILAFLVFQINRSVVNSVNWMRQSEKIIEIVDDIESDSFKYGNEVDLTKFRNWCQDSGFRHDTDFLFYSLPNSEPILCSTQWSDVDKTWALIYILPTGVAAIDFVTFYFDDVSITTGSTKDALLLPKPPKSYTQAFTGISYPEQYAKHINSREYLEEILKLSAARKKQEIVPLVSDGIKKDMDYIKTLPFWYLKGVYWFFIRRHLKINTPIKIVK